jgi:hypothetical protein
MDVTFNEPVLARVQGTDGRSELLEIKTAREGISAMHQRGLGGYQIDDPEWQAAADNADPGGTISVGRTHSRGTGGAAEDRR